MLSPLLMLMLMLSHGCTMLTTLLTPTDTIMARGLLMLSPLLMPMLSHGCTMLTTQLTPTDTTDGHTTAELIHNHAELAVSKINAVYIKLFHFKKTFKFLIIMCRK